MEKSQKFDQTIPTKIDRNEPNPGLYIEYAMAQLFSENSEMKNIFLSMYTDMKAAEGHLAARTAKPRREYVRDLERAAMRMYFDRLNCRLERIAVSQRRIEKRCHGGSDMDGDALFSIGMYS